MRSFKIAVTTKWEAKYIKRITKVSGAEWEPCSSPEKIDMNETGLYYDAIPPYTWTDENDKEAYVVSSGVQRRDTLVCTIRIDGEGFVSFIKHKNMNAKTINKQKFILDKGTKGMNLVEMKKWVKQFIDYAEPNDILIISNE